MEYSSNDKVPYWIYTIKVKNRDNFMKHMEENKIIVSRVHERNDKHSAVQQFQEALPSLDSFIDEMVCIPVGWWVTEEDRKYIVETIKQGDPSQVTLLYDKRALLLGTFSAKERVGHNAISAYFENLL